MTMTLKQAKEITGHRTGLGKPSKMPGYTTAISAHRCVTGSKLAKIPGTPCFFCYALDRGNYQYPDVKAAHERRFQALINPLWVDAMVRLIGHYTDPTDPFFRVHDAGDFQSIAHVLNWCEVARRLPTIRFWVPTQERGFIRAARNLLNKKARAYSDNTTDAWPVNLVVRVSSTRIGQRQSSGDWLTSSVSSQSSHGHNGYACPAYSQGNKCGPCRACWDLKTPNIDYKKH